LDTVKADAYVAQSAAQAARDRVARLQQAREEAAVQEERARLRIGELEQRMTGLETRAAEIDAEIARLQTQKGELQQAMAASAELERQLEQARAARADAQRREAEAREALGRLRAELEQVAEAEHEAAATRDRVARAERQGLVYEILDQACGKKAGVPALIVENAVPALESIANDLLGRMAGGRLQVRLDTQAETKAGTMAEVLRITVLDGGEERPYQTYSGAERFMIDLALRIALSRFLAHRAGAEIRLLVLDEGLGALDAANRQQVVAALQEAAREFGKVLVITHIQELQDALPQRIEVERRPDGSRVRVA
jgi:exonuclease SbcC